ncbi:transmembrane protein 203-like [Saccoglossus kowalevskii]|uniref:Transmembrane protein 203-like n=1 Tax=Saccoglossus kowalevskii TaxID=10224 RepID=A0ABM0GLR9_SACKO|nr:PREDICTED: transmembrane protein 203-like [Saccoglossus kowalevskii]
MIFTLKEVVMWLGVTAFELWINLVTILIFSILLALKLESVVDMTWWEVFIPLFTCDGLNAYFCAIVFIRLWIDRDLRTAGLRAVWSALVLIMVFIFEMLLCQRLEDENNLSFSLIMSPVFILLQMLMIRACQVG